MPNARVVAELAGDGSGFERMLRSATAQAETFANDAIGGLKGQLAGLFTVGAIAAGIHSVIDYASHIHDLAKQADITTDEVQRIGYAAKESGLEFEDFQTALSKMGAARRDAAEKNDDLARKFERFGVSMEDLQNPMLRNMDLMYRMADAASKMDLTSGDRQTLRDFFGKSGDKLAEALAHLNEFKDRPIISAKDIEAINRFDKSTERLVENLKVLAAGPIANIADKISDAIEGKNRTQAIVSLLSMLNTLHPSVAISRIPELFRNTGGAPSVSSATPSRGGIISKTTAAPGESLYVDQRQIEAMQMQDKLTELQLRNSLKLLTPEERRLKLLQEINALLGAGNALSQLFPNDQRLGLGFKIKAEEKIGELEGIKNPKIPSDSLTRVGNFIGSGASNIASIQERIVRENTKALENLRHGMDALGKVLKSVTGFSTPNPYGVPPV